MDENEKIRDYYRIYEEIYREHTISSHEISVNTGILKNKVSKYVKEMYERSVLKGPFISLHPARNYRSYAAFCKFEDPMPAYQESKGAERQNLIFVREIYLTYDYEAHPTQVDNSL